MQLKQTKNTSRTRVVNLDFASTPESITKNLTQKNRYKAAGRRSRAIKFQSGRMARQDWAILRGAYLQVLRNFKDKPKFSHDEIILTLYQTNNFVISKSVSYQVISQLRKKGLVAAYEPHIEAA